MTTRRQRIDRFTGEKELRVTGRKNSTFETKQFLSQKLGIELGEQPEPYFYDPYTEIRYTTEDYKPSGQYPSHLKTGADYGVRA